MRSLSALFSVCSLVLCPLVVISIPAVDAAELELAPKVEWVISAGGPLHDKTRGIAVDGLGHVLLTGEFTGTAKFGEHTVTSVGDMDFFVAKVDQTGKFLWVRTGGGAKVDRGYAITADRAGNSYVTGHYESPEATFEQTVIKPVGNYDIFIAKYDPAGQLVWIKSAGGVGYDYGHGIAADQLGNVFVAGAFVGEGTYDSTEKIGHTGSSHVFCFSVNSDGKLVWNHVAEGPGSSSAHAVAVDHQGNCFVGGSAGGVSSFAGKDIDNVNGTDLLVTKFDASGMLVWTHTGHGSSNALIHEITADKSGNVWAVGMFQKTLKLDDRQIDSQGMHDILLTSFDSTGKRLWTKTSGHTGIDYGLGIATDGAGNSIMTGSFTGQVKFDQINASTKGPASDIQIVNYDREGTLRWYLQGGSDRTDHAYTIVSDYDGSLYLSGACSGAAKFEDHQIPNRGSNDIFLVKLASPESPSKKP